MGSEVRRDCLSSVTMDSISERLSSIDNLYYPRALHQDTIDPPRRKVILLDLLSRDVPIFLERYGSELTFDELREFETLNEDYEVKWHVNRIRTLKNPTSDEARSRSVMVKNRRRAYMDRLICEGDYFSEDAMREREPYLHHEYLGKFQDSSCRAMPRPGEKWSDTLLRRAEEAVLIEKIRGEQQRMGVDERDWVGSESKREDEEQEEEDWEADDEENGEEDDEENGEEDEELDDFSKGRVLSGRPLGSSVEASSCQLPAAEMEDQLEQFACVMQQKFLSGEDDQYLDYAKIDEDESLDDHWCREANYDAEEKYFAQED